MADTNTWVLDLSTNPPDIYNSAVQEHAHNALEPPYPANFWFVNQTEDDINHMGELQYHSPCFEPPYPWVYWYLNDFENDVIHDAETECEKMGAFYKCENLKIAVVPTSVISIGDNAFKNTDLDSITISKDCVYSSSTFPDDCDIRTV